MKPRGPVQQENLVLLENSIERQKSCIYVPVLILTGYVSQLKSLWSKYLRRKTSRKKVLFWAQGFRSLGHGRLTPLLWALAEAEHDGAGTWWKKAAQFTAARRERHTHTNTYQGQDTVP